MFKKLLIIIILVSFGYALAVFVPMPEDWAGDMKQPFQEGGIVGDSIIGEYIGVLPGGEEAPVEEAEEDTTQYAQQSDLLVRPTEQDVKYSVLMGDFIDQLSADTWLQQTGFAGESPAYIPYKDPLGSKSILLLAGQYDDQATAQQMRKQWQQQYDLSLQVVKFPILVTPEQAEAAKQAAEQQAQQEQNAKIMATALAEALKQNQQSPKQGSGDGG